MKKSEQLNLSEQTKNIISFAKKQNDVIRFFEKIDSLPLISIQDLSFQNDIELFKEIHFLLSVIFSIISHPHKNNRKEEIVARSGEASALTEEDFIKTLRDSSIWKDQGNGEILPEYVYYHQYEDDLRIYENIFIVHVINELSFIIDHYLSLYVSLLKVASSSNQELVENDSSLENALFTANKILRRLNQIKESYFYKDVSKAKNKPKVFYPTNILVKDRLYNIVYKFYKKNHIYDDEASINDDLYLYYFTLILKVLRKEGFEIDERNSASIYDKDHLNYPERLLFTNDEYRISIDINASNHSYLFKYKDKRVDALNAHMLVVNSDAIFEDVTPMEISDDIFTLEYLSLWHLAFEKDHHLELINQNLMDETSLITSFIHSHHIVTSGSEALYTSYCPSCKNKNIYLQDGFYKCPDCGSIYKIIKTKNAKNANKIIFASLRGQ